MELKKKTIIWEDNNEPPKDYIWIKSDGKAYEYSYSQRKWIESKSISSSGTNDGGSINYSEYLLFLNEAKNLIESTQDFSWDNDYITPISDYDEQYDDEYTINIGNKDAAEYVISYYLSDSNYGNIFVTGDEKDYLENMVTLPTDSNYTYVDLGLPSGTLWADSNIGYMDSGGNGYHFLYGIENPIHTYNVPSTTFKQFNTDALYNKEAIAPTRSQFEELLANTTVALGGNSVVDGVTLTGINGNSIFIPFSGYYNAGTTSDITSVGTHALLWTRNIINGYPSACVICNMSGELTYSFEPQYYENGCNVRSCKVPQ